MVPIILEFAQCPNGTDCYSMVMDSNEWSQLVPKGDKWFRMLLNGSNYKQSIQIMTNNIQLVSIVSASPGPFATIFNNQMDSDPI